jgi:outer membrane protein OmpA-like peptidoglycan-associated protein
MEASIEGLEADLDAARKDHADAVAAADRSVEKSKEQLKESAAKHEADLARLKEQIGVLEPLQSKLADRESELEQQKLDTAALTAQLAALQALPAELNDHKTKLATLGATLAAETAQKDSLAAQLADHKSTLETMQAHLQATVAEKDSKIGEMQAIIDQRYEALKSASPSGESEAKIAELRGLLDQRDEQLKSFDQRMRISMAEKDTVIGKLRAMVSQIEPIRTELQQRDRALEELQKRVSAQSQPPQRPNAGFEEAQRQLLALGAETQSLKAALEGKDAEIAALRSLETKSEDAEARVAMFQNQVVDLSGRHAAAQGKLDEWEARYAALEAKFKQQASVQELAGRDFEAKQAELERAQAEVRALDEKLMAALKTAATSTDQAAMLTNQVVDVTGRHAGVKGELEDWAAKYAALEAKFKQQASDQELAARDFEAKHAELERAQAEVRSLDSKLMTAIKANPDADVALALEQAKARVEELEAELAEVRTPPVDERGDMLERQIVDVTGRHAAAKGELDEWSTKYAALDARLRQLTSDHELATRSLETKQAELEQARAEVRSLDTKLMTALQASRQIADLEKDLDAEVPREAKLRAQIAANQSEMAELRAQIADRDERLEAWDSRFHASVVEAPRAMAAAAGSGYSTPQVPAPPPPSPPPPSAAQRAADARQLKALLEASLPLNGVQFLPKSSELIPQALPILAKAADAMLQFPDVSIEIAGHTDSWGLPHDNLRLSQQRAAAVKEALINSGVAAWRLLDTGYGDTRPIESNDTPDGRFANRRIAFHVRQ